jgi:hypothetical protein
MKPSDPSQQTDAVSGRDLIQVGQITADAHWVRTPIGAFPTAQVTVSSADQTSTISRTPAWAVVMAILFVWVFFLSLLFLLARKHSTSGFVGVTVQYGTISYTEEIAVFTATERLELLRNCHLLEALAWPIPRPASAVR